MNNRNVHGRTETGGCECGWEPVVTSAYLAAEDIYPPSRQFDNHIQDVAFTNYRAELAKKGTK